MGVFRDSESNLSGHFLGRFASGYDSFRCDLTDLLNDGGKNVRKISGETAESAHVT